MREPRAYFTVTKVREPMDLKVSFIGICELAGAVGLILPALTNVMPLLTAWTAVATRLGFAPIELGRLNQGGVPLHAVDGEPGGLLFQNVEKLTG